MGGNSDLFFYPHARVYFKILFGGGQGDVKKILIEYLASSISNNTERKSAVTW